MLDPVDAAALKFTQNAMERCASPMLQRKFVALGGVDMLMHFLTMSVNDDVVASAAMVLHMLEVSSKVACLKIIQNGGASSLLVQLQRTRNHRVLLPVITALRAMVEAWRASQDDYEWCDLRLFEGHDDAIEVLVGLLKKSDNQRLRLESAVVIYHMCTLQPQLVLRAGQAGAVESLVAMTAEGKADGAGRLAQHCAVNVLCVLLMAEENHERFTACNGHVATVELLGSSRDGQVVEQAARALSNYMCTHKAQLQVAAAGGAEALVAAVQRAREAQTVDEAVMEQVCAAICNLTFENDSNRIKVGEVGGCAALVRLCKGNRSDRVLEQACAAIGNICKKNRTNRSLIGAVGGCEMLLEVIASSPSEPTAVQAVRAIGNVGMRSPENQLKLAAGDGLRLLLQLIETLSLRLAPAPPSPSDPGDPDASDAPAGLSGTKRPRSPGRSASAGGRSPSLPRSSASTPRGGRAAAQHEESFLQLTLSALSTLASNECCRLPLARDLGAGALLHRIGTGAQFSETQAVARRLLATIGMHDWQEEDEKPPAPGSSETQQQQQQQHREASESRHTIRVFSAEEQGAGAGLEGGESAQSRGWRGSRGSASGGGSRGSVGSRGTSKGHRSGQEEDWDSSDYAGEEEEEEGEEIADHHSDAGSVRSFHSRSSAFSRSSRPRQRPASSAGSTCGSVVSGMGVTAEEGELMSERRSSSGGSSLRGLFSESEEESDELDVEAEEGASSRTPGGGGEESETGLGLGHGAGGAGAWRGRGGAEERVESGSSLASGTEGKGVGERTESEGSGEGWYGAASVGGTPSTALGPPQWEEGDPMVYYGAQGEGAEGPGSGGKSSRVEDLIGAQKLTLEIAEAEAPRGGGGGALTLGSIDETMREVSLSIDAALGVSAVHTPEGAARVAVCASPLSGEGYGLPPELLQALTLREVPTDAEAAELGERRQLQKALDAWLDVAEALQRQEVASKELDERRHRRQQGRVLSMWREAMDEEESDDGAAGGAKGEADGGEGREGGAGAEGAERGGGARTPGVAFEGAVWSPTGEGKEGVWAAAAVQAVQSEDSVSTLGGSVHPSRSVCSEESFSTDVRAGPSMPFVAGMPGMPKPEGLLGASGDAVSVASEASTGTVTSEPSATTVLFEWGANMAGGVPTMMGAMAGSMAAGSMAAGGVVVGGGGAGPIPHSPWGRGSAEAALEASRRAMQTLLTQHGGGGVDERDEWEGAMEEWESGEEAGGAHRGEGGEEERESARAPGTEGRGREGGGCGERAAREAAEGRGVEDADGGGEREGSVDGGGGGAGDGRGEGAGEGVVGSEAGETGEGVEEGDALDEAGEGGQRDNRELLSAFADCL